MFKTHYDEFNDTGCKVLDFSVKNIIIDDHLDHRNSELETLDYSQDYMVILQYIFNNKIKLNVVLNFICRWIL